ncbi:M4 family metallopeptidase [Nocardioides insulae]|uniref:M4 family metallopeptidase n=1 Tax=Nocardioides insulae TaxID=394734 RepID=UPI00146D57D5|nr:M4 family metallopeptidase [Nocardioides insulae]
MSTDGDLFPGPSLRSAAPAAAAERKTDAFLTEFAPAFGAPADQLVDAEVRENPTGYTVEYTQEYDGVPVFASDLLARVDQQGQLTSVNGFLVPDLGLSTTPSFTKDQAAERALATVRELPVGHDPEAGKIDTGGLEVKSNELMIYRMGTTRGIEGEAKLAWVLEVSNDESVRETVILDALTGKALNRYSMMAHALDRHLYEAYRDDNGTPEDPSDDTVGGLDAPVWSEGDAFPADLNQDHQNEVLGTSEAYWMFMNTFGRDSYDGEGSPMITVNNDPRISCPNANWNGVTTNYCSGVTGDDTVAHEWGHAYTEYTSGLIYQWQAGAMNEAYSDIWGETVDMLNARHNEGGETPEDAVLRTEGTCSAYTRSAISLEITEPATVAGPCTSAPASFGPVITQEPIEATAVVATDPADDAGPSATDGCSAFDNAAEIAGNWAYVDRGTCGFAVKAANAEAAGASGIVVGNTNADAPISMSGDADIYGVMVAQADGAKFKTAGGPVDFRVWDSSTDAKDDTYRWLSGESDPAFGGAIRDMWNPNCYGDPGKVSDEEYHCSAEDGGGVHTNSGVVNRTFAVLVDGSAGEGVEPIGLDKAANLFWRAQSEYLTPSSFFPDLANALESSCADLTGAEINQVTLGDPTAADGSDGAMTPELADPITAADCSAVTAAIAATELRLDPTAECAWEPILADGAPQLNCGEGTSSVVSYEEDFEDGLAGWTQDSDMVYGAEEIPWEGKAAAEVPGGHDSAVAYAPDPTSGSCAADAEDISSRSGLTSPDITVPAGETPRLSFDHYVATEAGWDGGNVKVSVNGGDFAVIPADAYLFNAPGGTLETAAAGNTSPMAGEIAWTGTDGGELTGSWGTSIVDLSAVAQPGDTVQIRFDMGRDGCNGIDGWYVDNVSVESCDEVADLADARVFAAPALTWEGRPAKVRVLVVGREGRATGTVTVTTKRGRVLGSAELGRHGYATVRVSGLDEGKHRLIAAYSGDQTYAPAEDGFEVRVLRGWRHGHKHS